MEGALEAPLLSELPTQQGTSAALTLEADPPRFKALSSLSEPQAATALRDQQMAGWQQGWGLITADSRPQPHPTRCHRFRCEQQPGKLWLCCEIGQVCGKSEFLSV